MGNEGCCWIFSRFYTFKILNVSKSHFFQIRNINPIVKFAYVFQCVALCYISKFFVVNMGLFFVPALVGTLQYVDVLKTQIVPFLAVTFLTTPVVYLAAAWSVQLLMKVLGKKEGNEA